MKRWMLVLSAVVAVVLFALPAVADWDPNDPHKMHHPQLPDQNDELEPGEFSWDVKLADMEGHSATLADDWMCSESGLVTDIHLWVSWLGDAVGEIGLIEVSIWSDLPDPDPNDPNDYSMPLDLLWGPAPVAPAPPGVTPHPMEFSVRPYGPPSPQGFYDPMFHQFNYPDHSQTFQINIQLDPEHAFYQEAGTVYWLSVFVPDIFEPTGIGQLGWKTSENHWNDDSVIGFEVEPEIFIWEELRDPIEPGISLDQAFVITADLDWGDAPDNPGITTDFPTLFVSNGAVHIADYVTYMGFFVDPESDGQPTAAADGDDTNDTWPAGGSDDEDGVQFVTNPLNPGLPATVNVTASVPGYLNAWIDFNGDSDWADAGEWVFQDVALMAGVNALVIPVVPLNADLDTTYARFRFTSYDPGGTLSYNGVATDGEVEDHRPVISESGQPRDFGDATDNLPGPAPYPTFLSNNGARHYLYVSPPVYLGGGVDADADGQPLPFFPTDDGDGNDDEDGVIFTSPVIPGVLSSVQVTAGTPGILVAWLDGDGAAGFHAPDLIIPDTLLTSGTHHLVFTPGPVTSAASELRFRFDSGGGLAPTGLALDGEVEDHVMPPARTMDYGDLPDSGYGTLLASDGARHFITPGYALGTIVDAENDGVPTGAATGDDTAGSDDEDGVTFTSQVAPGYLAAVTVTATGSGVLNAWLDGTGNGFQASDQVFTNQPISAGANNLVFTVPGGATAWHTRYMRFRFNSGAHGNPGYDGYQEDGEVEDHAVEIASEADIDYGDAPESATSYPTTLANDGPRHWIGSVYLGSAIDGEFDGQPTTDADGDDTTGTPDDEDGITFPTGLRTAGYAQAEVDVVGGGYLNGWIDYNDDGDWDDVGEHVFNDLSLAAGEQQVDFDVPADAVVGDIHARFRISSQSGLGYSGEAPDGEVEDYKLEILQGYDFGDAPSPYPTLDASSGAKHQILSGYYMGSTVDAEADGQPNSRSSGDDEGPSYDDEDAIRMTTLMVPGSSATVEVTSSQAGKLSAWVDFNADGDWGDAGEKILNDVTVNGIGAETFGFSVPAGADLLRPSYARFRFSTATGLSYTGTAVNGEVEDHILENELFSDGFESGDTSAW